MRDSALCTYTSIDCGICISNTYMYTMRGLIEHRTSLAEALYRLIFVHIGRRVSMSSPARDDADDDDILF